jgi:hypothetical protein
MVKKIDIAISASILAYGLGCSVHDLKNRLFEQFDSEPPQPEELELLFYYDIYSEAKSLGMHPYDTPAAIRLIMMHEYLSTHCFLAEDNPDLFDELYVGSGIGDTKYINELLSDHLDIPIRHHESLTDNCDGMNSRKIINMDELITSLYQLCIQEIEQINNYEQLSEDGKFEALIFMSSIILDPEFYFELPFSEILDEFLATMNNYAIENGIKIDISNLAKFIRERQLFYFIEVAKTRNPDYVLKEVFATLFERPLLSELEFIINNLDNSLLSENKLPKSVMVDFTKYLKSEVIHFVKSEVKLILSKYK